MEISPSWEITATLQGVEEQLLQLQVICPAQGPGFVYVFSNVSDALGIVEPTHPCMREVLLFAPVVCFLKFHDAFQALSYASWKELNASVCFEHYGASTPLPLSLDDGDSYEDEYESFAEVDSCQGSSSELMESDLISETSEVLGDSGDEMSDSQLD